MLRNSPSCWNAAPRGRPHRLVERLAKRRTHAWPPATHPAHRNLRSGAAPATDLQHPRFQTSSAAAHWRGLPVRFSIKGVCKSPLVELPPDMAHCVCRAWKTCPEVTALRCFERRAESLMLQHCTICNGSGWVCVLHPDQQWRHEECSGDAEPCRCNPGAARAPEPTASQERGGG